MKTRAEHVASYKARNRAKGLCGSCPRPWAGPQHLCEVCRAKKAATSKAKREAFLVEQEAAGIPRRPVGWNGFQHRPQDINRTPTPRTLASLEAGRAKACRTKRMATSTELLRDVRRRLFDVPGVLESAQVSALLPIFLRVHRLGIERERARLNQLRYRQELREVG
jgi:hypothetical protein